ncbi:PREDICTED: mitochondrial antiviral-signaling protein [Chrysochloris asiatica]|uniref:Mitochondrial antiviral-signaling protein n=1 Tax=Chrysochloris asiatica TaxID=185453 RepID=A0A9B0UCX4_CHRAS|nr:PREDICTED: mitochondrial antiviral-signaling protein [Chrysochloris asiatica]
MTFAEDKTYQYIRYNFTQFCDVSVIEILPYLSCLTASDQDHLQAIYSQRGNRNTLWYLFNFLKRRSNWVDFLIEALRSCELTKLAEEVASVYRSYLPRTLNHPPAQLEPLSVPAEVPGPSAKVPVTPSTSHNGYREDEPSYLMPVQESPRERSEQTPQTPSSGAIPRRPRGPLEPSSDLATLSSLTFNRHQERDTELGIAHAAGMVSSPTSPCGPVSPSVSFQPLARSTPRASRSLGPPVSASPTGTPSSCTSTSLPSAEGAGDQSTVTICSSETEEPSHSMITNSASCKLPTMPANPMPSKVPSNLTAISTVPTKLFTAPENTGSSKVPANSAPISTRASKLPTVSANTGPSKVPTNSAHISTAPSKLPTSVKSPETVPSTMLPSRLPTNSMRIGTVPTSKSISRPEEIPEIPAPAGPRGGAPWPGSRLSSELELSKPEELVSQVDSQLYSGTSEDLAISHSVSLDGGPSNIPEEDEYESQSTGSFEIHVTEAPSVDLQDSNSKQLAAPQPPEQKPLVRDSSWALWLGATTAGLLLATLLTMLYRRRLRQ